MTNSFSLGRASSYVLVAAFAALCSQGLRPGHSSAQPALPESRANPAAATPAPDCEAEKAQLELRYLANRLGDIDRGYTLIDIAHDRDAANHDRTSDAWKRRAATWQEVMGDEFNQCGALLSGTKLIVRDALKESPEKLKQDNLYLPAIRKYVEEADSKYRICWHRYIDKILDYTALGGRELIDAAYEYPPQGEAK